MDLITVLVLAAAIGAAYALGAGIVAMARNSEVARSSSKVWMVRRVAWQALAVMLIMFGVMGSAATTATLESECIYDYKMLTNTECHAYREKVLAATSNAERLALQDELHSMLSERARGVPASNWRGLRK